MLSDCQRSSARLVGTKALTELVEPRLILWRDDELAVEVRVALQQRVGAGGGDQLDRVALVEPQLQDKHRIRTVAGKSSRIDCLTSS